MCVVFSPPRAGPVSQMISCESRQASVFPEGRSSCALLNFIFASLVPLWNLYFKSRLLLCSFSSSVLFNTKLYCRRVVLFLLQLIKSYAEFEG